MKSVFNELKKQYWKHIMTDKVINLIKLAGIKNMQKYEEHQWIQNITWKQITSEKTIVERQSKEIWITHWNASVPNEDKWSNTQMFLYPLDYKYYLDLIRSGRRDYLNWTCTQYKYLNDLSFTDVTKCNMTWYCDICNNNGSDQIIETQHYINIKNPNHKSFNCDDCKLRKFTMCEPCKLTIDVSQKRMKCKNTTNDKCSDFDMCLNCYGKNE